MKHITVVVLVILVVALLLGDAGARARGGRGGGRGGGGRSGGSRSRGGGGGGYSSKPRITKTTPIKATKFSSPVIKAQATVGSRSRLFTKLVAGYLVTKYLLSIAPVYRRGFPVHGSYVSIPEDRAVRLTSESVSLLDSNGNFCLGRSSSTRILRDGIENNLIELNTTVKYKGSPGNTMTLYGLNNTVSLNDIKEKNFTVTTRARYNVTVVYNTDCTQVEKQVNGTMVQLYEFNPNGASIANINVKLLVTSIALFAILNNFKTV